MFTRSTRLLTTFILPASLLLALFALFRPAAPLQAATLTVDTFVDERDFSCADGDCSLRDAVIVAAPGDTISVPAGNYQLTLSGGLGPLVVDSDLIITGVSSATTIITNDGCGFANCGSLVSVTSGATLTLNNITLANSRANGFPGFNGGGVLVGNGHLIINDANISNNGAPSGRGGGVAVLNGTLTLNSGAISNNTSYDDGAGVYLAGATASFTMNGGTIANNFTQCTDGCASGGGVYAASGTFTLTAGTISGNRSDNGAAVFYGSGGGTISGGTIRDNRNTFLSGPRGGVGGGISILSGIVTMSGGQIISNTGRVDGFFPGGGVRVENATFNMNGGLISHNEAYRGGAVMVQTGTFNFSGGTLENNTANYGGAVYLNNDTAYMYQSGGIVASNTATTTTDYGGGAFYVTLGHYIGTGGEIRENFSHYYGGAVSIANGTASFDGMSIISNTATITGGLIHLRDNGAVVTITNNIIRGNVPNAVASTNVDVDVFFEGNDVSYHTVALHMPFGRMLAYANNFENNTVAIDAAGNGGFDGRHNWFGDGATEASTGDADAFAFRLGAPRVDWSASGSLADSSSGRLATIAASSGTGTAIIISHGRDANDEPFATNAFNLRCSDYFDFYVIDGSPGSTWDVSVPIDDSVSCESGVAGGTVGTNLLYKFVTSSTVPGAPDTSCSSVDCWELWSDFGTISRSGSAGSYTLTADDVPLDELLGTPFVAGLRSSPTAISLSTFAPEVPAGSALVALAAIAALLLLLTVITLYAQRRILP